MFGAAIAAYFRFAERNKSNRSQNLRRSLSATSPNFARLLIYSKVAHTRKYDEAGRTPHSSTDPGRVGYLCRFAGQTAAARVRGGIQVGSSKDTSVARYPLPVRTRLKNGKITDGENRQSDVLFKRNGAWKIALFRYSAAQKKWLRTGKP